jgi:hypothetical protein
MIWLWKLSAQWAANGCRQCSALRDRVALDLGPMAHSLATD